MLSSSYGLSNIPNVTYAKTTAMVPQVLGLSLTSLKALLCIQWQEVDNEIVNANLITIRLSLYYTYVSDDDSISDTLVSAEFELTSYHFVPELSAEGE